MTCTKCTCTIERWEKFSRTKKGPHHRECPRPSKGASVNKLAEAVHELGCWLGWERESLELFHAYGQRFGKPGENVYEIVLRDALKLRGMTPEELKAQEGRA